MHEVQGAFCKTAVLWIITKITGQEKKHSGMDLAGPTETGTGEGCSPMGFGPVRERGRLDVSLEEVEAWSVRCGQRNASGGAGYVRSLLNRD